MSRTDDCALCQFRLHDSFSQIYTNLTSTNKAVNKHDVYSDPAFCHGVTSPNVRAGLLSCVCTLTKMRVASRGYWWFRNDLEDMEKQDRSVFIRFYHFKMLNYLATVHLKLWCVWCGPSYVVARLENLGCGVVFCFLAMIAHLPLASPSVVFLCAHFSCVI